jgi:hypothetical protein
MVRQEIETDETDTPRIRKRLMSDQLSMPAESAGEIDIASHASLAGPDATETIVLEFDHADVVDVADGESAPPQVPLEPWRGID